LAPKFQKVAIFASYISNIFGPIFLSLLQKVNFDQVNASAAISIFFHKINNNNNNKGKERWSCDLS
jgi:hypothetical protein